ncbi:MAG: XdhC family protein [Eubacteriales bacterium]|nr:XdhC family protein [Eubacteriales bacterium]
MKKELERVFQETKEGRIASMNFEIEDRIYTRVFRPKERLILLGGGHIAKALCTLATMVDFQVIVIDDRPFFANEDRFPEAVQVICDEFSNAIKGLSLHASDYVAIITRGHHYDKECIQGILSGEMPAYVGLLGSKRRTTALLSQMREEGFDASLLEQIHTPIGLEIGALTVEEIAVSIVAEMIKTRRIDLRKEEVSGLFQEETFHENVLRELVEKEIPKALLLVYETKGSTPVKSGCFMALDKNNVATGTIGGGLAENIAIKEALPMIGSGRKKMLSVDMTNKDSADQGMICGGSMKVLIQDL